MDLYKGTVYSWEELRRAGFEPTIYWVPMNEFVLSILPCKCNNKVPDEENLLSHESANETIKCHWTRHSLIKEQQLKYYSNTVIKHLWCISKCQGFTEYTCLCSAILMNNLKIVVCSMRYNQRHTFHVTCSMVAIYYHALWKHAYSNILKMLPPKNENFQIKKIWDYFIFLLKT